MPMLIYSKWLQRIGVFFIPVFFITNFPAMFLTGGLMGFNAVCVVGPGDLSDGGQVVLELCSKELQQRQQLGCRYLLLFFIRAFLMAHYLRLHSSGRAMRAPTVDLSPHVNVPVPLT